MQHLWFHRDFEDLEDVVTCRQRSRLTKFEKMWNSQCIAIEDPFELSHNLGAGISRKSKENVFASRKNQDFTLLYFQ